MLLSAEKSFRGSLCITKTKGHVVAPQWSGASSPAGVAGTCANGQLRFPRNLGDLVVSSVTSRLDLPGQQLLVSAAHSSAEERTKRVQPRYRQTRKRSAVGWTARSHSVLILPMKLANFTLLEPVEGSETPNHGTVFEKHDECLEIRSSCPRNRNG